MCRITSLLSLGSIAMVVAGIVAMPVQAQQSPAELANDGMSLARESEQTRATFTTVFGERAPSVWKAQHEAELAIGAPTHPVHLAFMAQNNGIGDLNGAQREAILTTLRSLGYAPGRDIVIEWNYPTDPRQALDPMAQAIVSRKPDIILTNTTPVGVAVAHATSIVPVVFSASGDPLGSGLVKNLEHPGGNITGVLTLPFSVNQQNVDLLKEIVPRMTRLAVIRSTYNPLPGQFESVRSAAEARGVTVLPINVEHIPDDLDKAIDAAVEGRADAILQIPDGTFSAADQKRLAQSAMQKRIPFFAGGRPAVVDGGLLTTVAGNNQALRIAVTVVDRILKGAKPGDIPVAAPVVDQLIINTRTAEAIGLAIPASVLARATELLR
jgi:putative ABC transport system substrate-binding protein